MADDKATRSTSERDDADDKSQQPQHPHPHPSSAEPTMPWYRQLLAIKNTLLIIITPLLFLPLVIVYPTPVGQSFLSPTNCIVLYTI